MTQRGAAVSIYGNGVRRRPRWQLLMGIALAAVGATSCGGDGKPESARSTSTLRQGADDEAAARAIVLRASDLPEGWSSSPNEPPTDEEDAANVRLYTCLDLPTPAETNTADVDSLEFEGDGATIEADVTFVRSRAIARRELSAFRQAEFVRCLEDAFSDLEAEEGSDVAVENQIIERRSAPELADGSVAVRIRATLTDGARSVEVLSDQVYVLVARIWIGLEWTSTEPMPTDFELELLNTMVSRAQAAGR